MKVDSIACCLMFISLAWLPGSAQNHRTGEAQQPATEFPVVAQHPPTEQYSLAAQYDAMAKATNWGEKSVRIFRDSNLVLNFKLTTSWILGADHQGTFRYKLTVFPKIPTNDAQELHEKKPDTPEDLEKFLARARNCNFGLMLNDSDGFLLRTVPLSFVNVVDVGDAQNIGLMGNSTAQMDADEYLKFLGSDGAKGTWQVSWGTACTLQH